MAPRPARPKPRRNTLTLLVGRVTTIKLAYWAAVTAVELALPLAIAGPLDARTPASVAAASLLVGKLRGAEGLRAGGLGSAQGRSAFAASPTSSRAGDLLAR